MNTGMLVAFPTKRLAHKYIKAVTDIRHYKRYSNPSPKYAVFFRLSLGSELVEQSIVSGRRRASCRERREVFWLKNSESKSDKVMLVTTLYWWIYDGDNFKILVAEQLMTFPMRKIDHQYIKSVSESPTSQVVTNIQTIFKVLFFVKIEPISGKMIGLEH